MEENFWEMKQRLYEIFTDFANRKGNPSLIVVHASFKFPAKEMLGDKNTLLVALPTAAWETNKVYMENAMFREVMWLAKEK